MKKQTKSKPKNTPPPKSPKSLSMPTPPLKPSDSPRYLRIIEDELELLREEISRCRDGGDDYQKGAEDYLASIIPKLEAYRDEREKTALAHAKDIIELVLDSAMVDGLPPSPEPVDVDILIRRGAMGDLISLIKKKITE